MVALLGVGGRRRLYVGPSSRSLLWLLVPICAISVLAYKYRINAERLHVVELGTTPAIHGHATGVAGTDYLGAGVERPISNEQYTHIDEHTLQGKPVRPHKHAHPLEHKDPHSDDPADDVQPNEHPSPDPTLDPDELMHAYEPSTTEDDPSHNDPPDSDKGSTFIEPLPSIVSIPSVDAAASGDNPDYLDEASASSGGSFAAVLPAAKEPFIFSDEDAQLLPACSQITPEQFKRIQESKTTTVHTLYNGNHVLPGDSIPAPAKVCVLVAVPQKMPPGGLFANSPVSGKWPDTIHLSLSSPSVRFSIPPLRALPSQPYADRLFSDETIIYYAELELPDAGAYTVEAEHESSNWYWAKHGWQEASAAVLHSNKDILERMGNMSNLAKFTASVQMEKRTRYPLIVRNQLKFPATVRVSGPLVKPSPAPMCHKVPEIDANKGKYFCREDHPHLRNETADEFGFAYDLDYCHLDYFDEKDTIDCLSNKVIHVFGDSNGRRLTRMILSGGRWCHGEHKCQGEDLGHKLQKIVLDGSGNIVLQNESASHHNQFEVGDKAPYNFGNNSKLYFGFFTSMAYEPERWLSRFYNKNDYTVPEKPANKPTKKPAKTSAKKQPANESPKAFNSSYIKEGAQAGVPFSKDKVDLVIAGLSSWDDAFDAEYSAFERTAIAYREVLMEVYSDPSTKLILRLNQGWCCRKNFKPDMLRRFTGTRIQHFADIARKAFRVKGGLGMSGRVHVLDAGALSGRAEVVRKFLPGQLSTNHQRAAQMRTEAQIILNNVCTRDATGKAIWKS